MTDTLLESELFGHEKGAFTGATKTKLGLLETADGGTVFLDELGELSESTQVKLLRVLEDRKVRRIGGLEERKIDVRFVAATNRDLEREVSAGRFRSDLFYRLAGIHFEIPPLRKRPADLQALTKLFAKEFSSRQGCVSEVEISPEAWVVIAKYRWPGNIRELRNTIERSILLSDDGVITASHLPKRKLLSKRPDSQVVSAQRTPTSQSTAGLTKEELRERKKIMDLLDECAGNQTRTAKKLGISRRTLVYRLERYRIPRPQKVYRRRASTTYGGHGRVMTERTSSALFGAVRRESSLGFARMRDAGSQVEKSSSIVACLVN
jgi:transcriptional regulator with PAS, ATPase and Fis domain